MPSPIVSVENLSKSYLVGHESVQHQHDTTLRDQLARHGKNFGRKAWDMVRGRQIIQGDEVEEFWALRDVSFEVQPGEVLGIIGHNGAGKSTLLKILSRITEPTQGRVHLRGRVASLLEVGTGFHPELSGRENVFLNGAILGMTRSEIRGKFDTIVDFAEVEHFIDTPVKRYSSGMYVRLAFAVAAHLEPEILVIDEVLAVGDVAFQRKCLGKMNEVAGEGRTVLFVSHNMAAVGRLCPRLIWLHDGQISEAGETADVLRQYLKLDQETTRASKIFAKDPTKDAQLLRVQVLGQDGHESSALECDHPIVLKLSLMVRRRLSGLYGYLEVQRNDGTVVMMSDSFDSDPNPLDHLDVGTHQVTLTIPARVLAAGDYLVYLNFTCPNSDRPDVDSPGIVAGFRLDDLRTRRGNNRPGFVSALPTWDVRVGVADSQTSSEATNS